ncbi:class F sortase [Streptomyces capitiformicae]|uniref:Class F sortase n=1 Tax=Streptomyces capitiformicae TaxID=2014920 RepID=A0A919GCB0_9ACTN|nr:class F sortase [Streptomyces capitiformicae]GHH81603.1 class F sortase [Streptomyces capitiformicae]
MTSLSRRAFATAAGAALLMGCVGGRTGDAPGPSTGPGTAPATSPPPPRASGGSGGSGGSGRTVAGSVPVGLRIPALGVDTPVIRLGLAPDGSVQVPPVTAHDRAGWYEPSPTPGRTGPSVILGHVTVGEYGDGVFRHLARLGRGERIEARLENGTTAVFTVDTVRTVAKAEFPTDAVYGNVDRPELRLITCGGPRTGDDYRDNVIVFASLSRRGGTTARHRDTTASRHRDTTALRQHDPGER